MTQTQTKQDLTALGRSRFFSSSAFSTTNTNHNRHQDGTAASINVRLVTLPLEAQAALAPLGPAVSPYLHILQRRCFRSIDHKPQPPTANTHEPYLHMVQRGCFNQP